MLLSNRILLGLLFGLIAGVALGERMEVVAWVGDVFLGLLQMTVLPYIIVSLISAVGVLKKAQAKTLARYAAVVLAVLWGLTLTLIALATLAFPQWQSASYFSPSMLEPAQGFDFMSTFLPINIFYSLGAGAVPAVVVFSVVLGVGVLRLAERDHLLKVVNEIQNAIAEMAGLVMRTAPVGVFAIAASAAGSLNYEALKGLYVYLTTLTVITALLTFWVFPMLVKTLTNVRYSEVLSVSRDALITAFATGNLFIVLPLIVENTRQLFLRSYEKTSDAANLVEVVVPAAFSLPVAGKLFALLFVLFAGWFTGEPVPLADYPGLLISGLFNLFASSFSAVPAILHSYKIPAEIFDLFLISENIFSNRLGAMTSVMFIVTLAILIATGVTKKWRWQPKAMLRFALIVLTVVLAMSYSLRFLYKAVGHDYTAYNEFIERPLLLPAARSVNRLELPAHLPVEPAGNTLERIAARKLLRFGYYRDWLPYAFHNQQGELVGLDVELAHQLARDLGVAVEFVRVYRKDVARLLDSGYLDMAAGVALTPAAISQFTLGESHISETLALLVHKDKRAELRDWSAIEGSKKWHLGVPNAYYLASSLRATLPNWQVEEIASPREFVKGNRPELDAIVFGAAGASAWTLLYPEYGVVVPQPALPPVPMAMPLASNDLAFVLYTRQWLSIKRTNGTLQKLTDYWIRGLPLHKQAERRWNLWDDVINAPEEVDSATGH
ncbi:cation:dicarboxylate symporter family transporter [Simiduia agarivorans]|uniref:Sodium/dicarboxylate symporter family protein n=1 Tax=Simiduia agarivorans (strain DSM 21679 / JCM 13881 / BCRC 17597 / SA1) TaxID=1117647 RepID=K4KM38_SIMAS|nr:cation:dicarboxylase symporter family transporter [Simiduia agarivorans]AFV00225.1 sodium/dicarboxylate symporter family protein [Simiduia agarivorans SA1 = DSM 21679]